jgi:hypothetical protein
MKIRTPPSPLFDLSHNALRDTTQKENSLQSLPLFILTGSISRCVYTYKKNK